MYKNRSKCNQLILHLKPLEYGVLLCLHQQNTLFMALLCLFYRSTFAPFKYQKFYSNS